MMYIGRSSPSILLWSLIVVSCFLLLYSFYIKRPNISIPAFDARYAKNIPPPSSPAKYPNIAVLVEFRSVDLLVSIVMNIFHHLPSSCLFKFFMEKQIKFY